jgi:MAF protein
MLAGWPFRTASVPIDETARPGELPEELVQRLSLEKARAVAKAWQNGPPWILSADTVVADGLQTFGKPASQEEAREFLRQLRGRRHRVLTGLTLLPPSNGRVWTAIAVTSVRMREYADSELEEYLKTGDPMDKAGAYGIQNTEFHPVADLEGCYANVMGLPLCHVQDLILAAGLGRHADLPGVCQAWLAHPCPVAQLWEVHAQAARGSREV